MGVGEGVEVGVGVVVGETVGVESGCKDCVASGISEVVVGVAVFFGGAFWIATIPVQ